MDPSKRLDQLTRDELVTLAQGLGVSKPKAMTRNELIAAIDAKQKASARVESREAQKVAPSSPVSASSPAPAAPPSAPPAEAPRAAEARPTSVPIVRLAREARRFPEHDLRQLDDATQPLPAGYGENRLVLLPRDPWWLYAYWELRDDLRDAARRRGGRGLVLRLFEAGAGGKGHMIAEQEVDERARSWYLNVPAPRAAYTAEIGMYTAEGEFLLLAGSNSAMTPPALPSEVVHDEFIHIPFLANLRELFPEPRAGLSDLTLAEKARAATLHERMYQAAHGLTSDANRGATSAAFARLHEMGSARAAGSFALASESLVRGERQRARSFWLVADAELIVFGATEPDAKVTLGGRPVPLRPDGSFALRFAFPDGRIDAPIEAVAADGEQVRRIRLEFERRTQL